MIPYASIDECLRDPALPMLLDRDGAECVLCCGTLVLTGRPIGSWAALKATLASNASVLLRRAL